MYGVYNIMKMDNLGNFWSLIFIKNKVKSIKELMFMIFGKKTIILF